MTANLHCDQIQIEGVIPDVTPTDGELVRRARSGDLDAFEALIARNRDRFLRYARQMLGTVEDAEEAAQDAFVRIHRALPQCDPERFGAWAFRILINRCRTLLRRRRWWRTRVAPMGEGVEASVDHPAGNRALREELDRALEVLAAEQREAFLLKYVEEMSYQEISVLTGASIPALKMRVSRACERLRSELREW